MNSKQNISTYGRFKTLPWFDQISQSRAMVLGQGGIGSHLTFFLARTGMDIITVDDDTVEEHNLGGQLYSNESVGLDKVEAMSKIITQLCGENNITPIKERCLEESEGQQWRIFLPLCDVVCVSFDSIAARRIVFDIWKKEGKKDSLFVDGRMSAEQGQVFTLSREASPEKYLAYENTFFSDSELPEAPCTAKATSHCGSLIASLMTAQITNWFSNKVKESLPRIVADHFSFYLGINHFTS